MFGVEGACWASLASVSEAFYLSRAVDFPPLSFALPWMKLSKASNVTITLPWRLQGPTACHVSFLLGQKHIPTSVPNLCITVLEMPHWPSGVMDPSNQAPGASTQRSQNDIQGNQVDNGIMINLNIVGPTVSYNYMGPLDSEYRPGKFEKSTLPFPLIQSTPVLIPKQFYQLSKTCLQSPLAT